VPAARKAPAAESRNVSRALLLEMMTGEVKK
jgi:hypothetical protein